MSLEHLRKERGSAAIRKSRNTRKYNGEQRKLFSKRQNWIKPAIVICCVMDVDIYTTSEPPADQKHYFTYIANNVKIWTGPQLGDRPF